MERKALVSDVHGNLTAFEAVLADIDRRGIDRVLNLGDYVGKGPRGREVVEYEVQLEGRAVFNTGSVGNCMGDPTPMYCILEGDVGGRERRHTEGTLRVRTEMFRPDPQGSRMGSKS